MPPEVADVQIIQEFFRAMHSGAEAGDRTLVKLFDPDAVLIEPFTGQPRTHAGLPAIRAWFAGAVQEMPPDMRIHLDRVDLEGSSVRAEWTCTSSVFKSPMRGYDLYSIANGRIHRAEFFITQAP